MSKYDMTNTRGQMSCTKNESLKLQATITQKLEIVTMISVFRSEKYRLHLTYTYFRKAFFTFFLKTGCLPITDPWPSSIRRAFLTEKGKDI